MRKIFILGGSQLQMDLILEAKKMFFYTIVLDGDKNCIGSKSRRKSAISIKIKIILKMKVVKPKLKSVYSRLKI